MLFRSYPKIINDINKEDYRRCTNPRQRAAGYAADSPPSDPCASVLLAHRCKSRVVVGVFLGPVHGSSTSQDRPGMSAPLGSSKGRVTDGSIGSDGHRVLRTVTERLTSEQECQAGSLCSQPSGTLKEKATVPATLFGPASARAMGVTDGSPAADWTSGQRSEG